MSSSSPLRTKDGVNPYLNDYAMKLHKVPENPPSSTFFNLDPVVASKRKRGRSGG